MHLPRSRASNTSSPDSTALTSALNMLSFNSPSKSPFGHSPLNVDASSYMEISGRPVVASTPLTPDIAHYGALSMHGHALPHPLVNGQPRAPVAPPGLNHSLHLPTYSMMQLPPPTQPNRAHPAQHHHGRTTAIEEGISSTSNTLNTSPTFTASSAGGTPALRATTSNRSTPMLVATAHPYPSTIASNLLQHHRRTSSAFSVPMPPPMVPISSSQQTYIAHHIPVHDDYKSTPQYYPDNYSVSDLSNPPPHIKHSLYKTELCRGWEETGKCRYGTRCQFAHGMHELRSVLRHPKYKTEVCRTWMETGSCPYGRRCCFIHGNDAGAEVMPRTISPTSIVMSANAIREPHVDLSKPRNLMNEFSDSAVDDMTRMLGRDLLSEVVDLPTKSTSPPKESITLASAGSPKLSHHYNSNAGMDENAKIGRGAIGHAVSGRVFFGNREVTPRVRTTTLPTGMPALPTAAIASVNTTKRQSMQQHGRIRSGTVGEASLPWTAVDIKEKPSMSSTRPMDQPWRSRSVSDAPNRLGNIGQTLIEEYIPGDGQFTVPSENKQSNKDSSVIFENITKSKSNSPTQ